MKPEYTFQFSLIGSGKKKLITREVGLNKGFDFDYNFSLQKIKENYNSPKDIRSKFFEVIKKVANEYNYKVEDGKNAITIKLVDHKNSKIIHSCDFGIVYDYIDEYDDEQQEIIVRDKNTNKPRYIWNERPKSDNHYYKLRNIEAARLWQELKSEYLKLKNKNKEIDKKSYQLFIEAVNNVYNQYDWQD